MKELTKDLRNNYMMSAVKTAMDYAILQHEVDKLKEIYSKYHDNCDVSDEELKDDLRYIEKIVE